MRNHYVVSLVKRLKNHYVITQNDPILLKRLKNHCVVFQFNPILFIRLRNHYVVSQKTMHLRIWTTLFLGSFVGDGNGENLNGSFNFSKANFCRSKNQYKILRKICLPHWKTPYSTLSVQFTESKKNDNRFSSYLANYLMVLENFEIPHQQVVALITYKSPSVTINIVIYFSWK